MEKEPTFLRPAKIVLAQERLNIQTDLSEQELDTVVEFLSKKIDKYIGEHTNETKKRLLLMALEISAEYFDVRRKYQNLEQNSKVADKEISMLNELLNNEMEKSAENTTL